MAAPLLAHRIEGEGETVLFLNGGLMTFPAWEPIATPVRRRFRTLLCDLRGQLLTGGEAHDELPANVDDLVALLDALGVDRAHVAGTSFGAEIGLLLAALHPGRVRSLIAATATDHATEGIRAGVAALRRAVEAIGRGGERGALHDLLVPSIYSPAWIEAHAEELAGRRKQLESLPEPWFRGLHGILRATERIDVRPWLERIRCPVLVVIAGRDEVMPPARSRALASAISGARTAVHEESGHALVVEDPEWLTATCLEFFSGLKAGRAGETGAEGAAEAP